MKGIAVFQNKLKGYVTFIQDDSKGIVKINGNISNLSPGKHGFHVHKYGNLLKTDCTKCGFDPIDISSISNMLQISGPRVIRIAS